FLSSSTLTSLQGATGYGPARFRTGRQQKAAPEPRSDSHVWTLKELNMTKLVKFAKDESGATAIEYGLIAAGISVAIIAVVQGLGSKLNTTLGSVSAALKYTPRRNAPAVCRSL